MYGRVPSPTYPMPNYQVPTYQIPTHGSQPAPGNWQPAPTQRMPVMAAMANVTPSPKALPRPTIRMQAPETLLPRPVRPLVLPSPESLGIVPVTPAMRTNEAQDLTRR